MYNYIYIMIYIYTYIICIGFVFWNMIYSVIYRSSFSQLTIFPEGFYSKPKTTFFLVFLPAQNMLPAHVFSQALGSNHNLGFLGSVARFRVWELDPEY